MKAYIVGSDSASRVVGNELELHIKFSIEKFILRLEARARCFVERQSKKLAFVENLGTAITPCNINIFVKITSICNNERACDNKREQENWISRIRIASH